MGARSPFIGREREMAILETVLQETAQGSGRVVLVAGEPGIGKTRLLAEAAERAAAQGWLVLFGRAYESEGVPPYLPFTEALGQYVKVCPPGDLRMHLGRGAAEVALLVPDLLKRVPGIEPSPPLSQDERYRLFEAVTGFLLSVANTHQPGVLLVIDDLHWADQATLLLLQHLARRLSEGPVLVAATCRTTQVDRSRPFTDLLAQFQRERLCEQLDVRPFSSEEAGQLIGKLAGASPSARVVASVHHRTGGNPFFLEEAVRHLSAEGRDLTQEGSAPADWGIPETVRQVIGSRLARLQPEALRVLQTASALGDPFSFDTLAAAAGADLAALLDALDEASACGFVREEGSGDYQFSHGLVRETIYAGLSGPRRALLHAQVGERLEALYQAKPAAHAGELAHHFLLGGRRGDLGKAIGYALQAAERATRQRAFEDAVRYYQVALDAHDKNEEQDEERRGEMLLSLATATFKTGDWDRCDEINLVAAEAARAAGLADLQARACLATAAYSPRPNPRVIPLIEQALAALPAGDSSSRSGLLSLLACQRSMAGSWAAQAPAREESIAMARRLGDARALAFALRNAYIEWDPNRLEERRRAVEEVVQLARELGDKELEVTSQCDHLTTSLMLCDMAAVDEGIEAHVRLADELQQRMQVAHGLMLRGMRSLLSGPLSRAEDLNAQAVLPAETLHLAWAQPSVDVHTLLLRWEQGRLAELEAEYRERHDRRLGSVTHGFIAFICAELGQEREARALLDQVDLDRLARLPARAGGTFTLALVSSACASVGATGQAEMFYRLLLPHNCTVVTVESASVCLGSTSRYLGMLATTLGRFADAERHFDDSDAMNTRLGARPLLAHTKVDRARLHLARHARGDAARARELLQEAAEAFDALEIAYHAGKAWELLESLQQATPARPVHPGDLSAREVEVLRLIAMAMSRKEIADQLVLSVRTVERHIANIYLKTGTHGRVAAAAYAQSHGLVPPPA
jgi:DNA-binding CsgD family transcriptional regulator